MKLKLDLEPKIPLIDIGTMRNKHLDSAMGGHKPVISKRGMEFDHYKEYLPTDDARLIDWKASIRSGRLQVRVFQEDKSESVLFIVDTSSSMVYGTMDKLKIEYAFEVLASLSFALLSNQDKIGLNLFNDQIVKTIPQSDGISVFGIIQETLYTFEDFGGLSNIIEPIYQCNQVQKDVNIVIFISDFLGVDQDFPKYLASIPQTMDVIGIMISDPIDLSIPKDIGLVSLKDPYTNEIKIINSSRSALDYTRKNLERIEMVEKSFDQVNGSFIALTTSEKFDEKLMNFFAHQKMKWL